MSIGAINCMNGCKKSTFRRGLCRTCYETLLAKINGKELNWEQAEADGKCLPSMKLKRQQNYRV